MSELTGDHQLSKEQINASQVQCVLQDRLFKAFCVLLNVFVLFIVYLCVNSIHVLYVTISEKTCYLSQNKIFPK